jgi:hypothetical protein
LLIVGIKDNKFIGILRWKRKVFDDMERER